VLGHDDQFVTARGTSWDVETNVVIAYEVKRRITTSDGRTYGADMIGVTGNAAASIALRNAIFKNIPTPFWKPIYLACRKVVAGDTRPCAARRDNMLHEFAVMGVTEERLCAAIEVKGKADITKDSTACFRHSSSGRRRRGPVRLRFWNWLTAAVLCPDRRGGASVEDKRLVPQKTAGVVAASSTTSLTDAATCVPDRLWFCDKTRLQKHD